MISEREDSRSSTQTASAYYRRRNRGDRLIVGRGLRPRGPQDEDADAIIATGAPLRCRFSDALLRERKPLEMRWWKSVGF